MLLLMHFTTVIVASHGRHNYLYKFIFNNRFGKKATNQFTFGRHGLHPTSVTSLDQSPSSHHMMTESVFFCDGINAAITYQCCFILTMSSHLILLNVSRLTFGANPQRMLPLSMVLLFEFLVY